MVFDLKAFQCFHLQWFIVPSAKNTIWLNPLTRGKRKKNPPASVFYSKHYFLLISRMFKVMFTFLFLIIIKNCLHFSFNFSLVYAWNFDSPSLHSCGIFPKYTGFKGFALSYLFAAEHQGKDNGILFQPGSKQGTIRWSKTSLFTF